MGKSQGKNTTRAGTAQSLKKQKSVTFQQIADLANVSLGTVSNVLNGNASVKEVKRKGVLEAVEKLGYRPNQLARWMRKSSTNIIGLLIPDISNPFFPAIVRGAEDIAYKNNYHLVLCNTDDDPRKEISYLEDLISFRPAGMLIVPAVGSTVLRSIGVLDSKVVFVDRCPAEWNGDSVVVDNEGGAYQAARHLLELGHRHFAIITGPGNLSTADLRLRGFQRALSEANIELPLGSIQESRFDPSSGFTAATRLLQMLPRPTAIFASDDLLASGCLSAAQHRGLRCPEDLSVVGFDNLDFFEHTAPSLTTVHQSGYQVGETACRILLKRFGNPELSAQRIVLPTELRIRDSTAPPADRAGHHQHSRKR